MNLSYTGHTFSITIGITMLILLLVGSASATKSIYDNAIGGDCASIGIWDAGTKTCTLTTDLTETVQIDSDGITLNGDGRTITGYNTGNGVYLDWRHGITIKNLNIKQFSYGIYLEFSTNNYLMGNIASNNFGGIMMAGNSFSNTLINNNASNNNYGIVTSNSAGNTLINNNASNNNYGILVYDGDGYTMSNNTVSNNYFKGISLSVSNYNKLSNNTVSNNSLGIYLDDSGNNKIYNNIFNNIDNFKISDNLYVLYINNQLNTIKTTGINIIGGLYLGGNFWAQPDGNGYSQKCVDLEPDGICDIPYQLDSNNIDYLPLTFAIPSDLIEPTTIIELSGTLGNNNWYTSDVQVNLTASDNNSGSGIAKTEYSLNEGVNWIQYSNPFIVSNEGTTTISYGSIDIAGNVEQTKNQMIKIDKNLPNITISSPEAKDYFQTGSLTLNFDAEDTISGIESITSSLDSNTVNNGAVIDLSTLTIGQHILTVNAIDKAGNTATKSVTFNIMENVHTIVYANVEVNPDTLNKEGHGGAVTAYIEIPGYDVKDIDVGTVKLRTNKGEVSAQLTPTSIGDNDGIPDRMVKFDREAVIGIVDVGNKVKLTISGMVSGIKFEGSDEIRVKGNEGPHQPPPPVPELPTIALMRIGLFGLMFLFQRKGT